MEHKVHLAVDLRLKTELAILVVNNPHETIVGFVIPEEDARVGFTLHACQIDGELLLVKLRLESEEAVRLQVDNLPCGAVTSVSTATDVRALLLVVSDFPVQLWLVDETNFEAATLDLVKSTATNGDMVGLRARVRVVDINGAGMVAARCHRFAVLGLQLIGEFLQSSVFELRLARADRDGRIAFFLNSLLQGLDSPLLLPVTDDLDIALATHVDVRVLGPFATQTGGHVASTSDGDASDATIFHGIVVAGPPVLLHVPVTLIATLPRPDSFTELINVREISFAALVRMLTDFAPVIGLPVSAADGHPGVSSSVVDA